MANGRMTPQDILDRKNRRNYQAEVIKEREDAEQEIQTTIQETVETDKAMMEQAAGYVPFEKFIKWDPETQYKYMQLHPNSPLYSEEYKKTITNEIADKRYKSEYDDLTERIENLRGQLYGRTSQTGEYSAKSYAAYPLNKKGGIKASKDPESRRKKMRMRTKLVQQAGPKVSDEEERYRIGRELTELHAQRDILSAMHDLRMAAENGTVDPETAARVSMLGEAAFVEGYHRVTSPAVAGYLNAYKMLESKYGSDAINPRLLGDMVKQSMSEQQAIDAANALKDYGFLIDYFGEEYLMNMSEDIQEYDVFGRAVTGMGE